VVAVVLVRRNATALQARRSSGLVVVVVVVVMDRKYRPIRSGRTWRTAMRLWILLLTRRRKHMRALGEKEVEKKRLRKEKEKLEVEKVAPATHRAGGIGRLRAGRRGRG
jgi:hypothetical protein